MGQYVKSMLGLIVSADGDRVSHSATVRHTVLQWQGPCRTITLFSAAGRARRRGQALVLAGAPDRCRRWLDSKIDVFLEEFAASGMYFDWQRAGELITGGGPGG